MLKYLIFPILLSFFSTIGEKITRRYGRSRHAKQQMLSFAAGITITFLFLNLLPDLFTGTKHLAWFLYLYVLLGFTFYLILQEMLYKYSPNTNKLAFELRESHAVIAFTYHFIIGIIFVEVIKLENLLNDFLFFLPIQIHVIFSSLASHHNIKTSNYQSSGFDKLLQWLVVIAPVLGALSAIYLNISQAISYSLIAVIGGILLFITIRELIPKPKEARPFYFILGMLVYISLLALRFLVI